MSAHSCEVCPQLSSSAEMVLNRCLDMLSIFQDKWPTVSGWTNILRRVMDESQSETTRPLSEVAAQETLLKTIVRELSVR